MLCRDVWYVCETKEKNEAMPWGSHSTVRVDGGWEGASAWQIGFIGEDYTKPRCNSSHDYNPAFTQACKGEDKTIKWEHSGMEWSVSQYGIMNLYRSDESLFTWQMWNYFQMGCPIFNHANVQ